MIPARMKQLLAVVALAAGLVAITPLVGSALDPGGTFSDDNSSIHEPAIEAIADEGITRGCNPPVNDLFCPSATVTREQMASFLVRALDLPAGTASFTDTAGSIHEADILALATAGITKGCNPPANDMYCPTAPVTREQMASFLARALDLDTAPRLVVSPSGDLVGVEVGTLETAAVDELTALFGTPTLDEPGRCPYILPADNMRYVRWGSLFVAIKTVDSGNGEIGLVGWQYQLDAGGAAEAGGPAAKYLKLPLGLSLLDPIGDAATVIGSPIETTPFAWTIVDGGYFTIEATGSVVDPSAPIDGVHQGVGFDCE